MNLVKKAKKGFTIVECVIAFSIITVICGVTIGIVQATVGYDAKLQDYTDMRQLADNALECFRYSDDALEFAEAINTYNLSAATSPAETNYYDLFIYTCKHCRLEIRADYTTKRPTFKAVCTSTAGVEIYSIDYEGT